MAVVALDPWLAGVCSLPSVHEDGGFITFYEDTHDSGYFGRK